MKRTLPPRVYEKGGTYWHVAAVGEKRLWSKLCRVRDGLPALYMALAALAAGETIDDAMPKVAADWLANVATTHVAKTQQGDRRRCNEIAEAFAEFRAGQVKPVDVAVFLRQFKGTPRTFNAFRSTFRELMRYAEEYGHRPAGTNPVASLRTMKTPPRSRYITDSELRRIKIAAMYSPSGKRSRSGPMLCALADMAYLTGQRIGDLLALEWTALGKDGIAFAPAKVRGSTGARVLIEWTTRLRALADRLKSFDRHNIRFVFAKESGRQYTYNAAAAAWDRAVRAAGITDVHFHDIRAKALTDVDMARGIGEAQLMGAHSTQNQTVGYIRHKTAKKTSATR